MARVVELRPDWRLMGRATLLRYCIMRDEGTLALGPDWMDACGPAFYRARIAAYLEELINLEEL